MPARGAHRACAGRRDIIDLFLSSAFWGLGAESAQERGVANSAMPTRMASPRPATSRGGMPQAGRFRNVAARGAAAYDVPTRHNAPTSPQVSQRRHGGGGRAAAWRRRPLQPAAKLSDAGAGVVTTRQGEKEPWEEANGAARAGFACVRPRLVIVFTRRYGDIRSTRLRGMCSFALPYPTCHGGDGQGIQDGPGKRSEL